MIAKSDTAQEVQISREWIRNLSEPDRDHDVHDDGNDDYSIWQRVRQVCSSDSTFHTPLPPIISLINIQRQVLILGAMVAYLNPTNYEMQVKIRLWGSDTEFSTILNSPSLKLTSSKNAILSRSLSNLF